MTKWIVVFSILFAGHLPAFRTALMTEGYLQFMDYMSIFAGWAVGMLVLELWIQHEFREELKKKPTSY